MTEKQIDRRVEAGLLLRVHRGVYRVGHHAPNVEARYMAAVLACGEGALLSGRAAAYLLGVVKGRPPAPEVTAPTKRRAKGIKTHQADVRDRTRWRGIPVTTVARTLVDVAPYLPEEELARACHEAGVRHHTTPRQVEAVLARRPNTDSYRFHNSRHAWEQDGRRERQARALGDEFRRYTWGDVFENPAAMLSELRILLQTTR